MGKWRPECWISCDTCANEQETDLESLRDEGVAYWARMHGWVQYVRDDEEYGYLCPTCAGKLSVTELNRLAEVVRTLLGWGSE